MPLPSQTVMPTPHRLDDFNDPWLVGYDAHGIQEFITASNRPLAMLGASHAIKQFDQDAARTMAYELFAGGGRGMEIVDGEAAARARRDCLVHRYKTATYGGAISIEMVPFDRARPAACLRWLRQRLDLVKDACPRPDSAHLDLYRRKSEQCADCGAYPAEHPSERRDGAGERVCTRCRDLVRLARKVAPDRGEEIQSLLDLCDDGSYVAAVSIDGNNLGAVFDSLTALDDIGVTGYVSRTIGEIFERADDKARDRLGEGRRKIVSLATGGDDIRLFLPQSYVLTYLEVFIPEVHAGADALDRDPRIQGRLKHFGVGVGVVLADPHLPAKRLMEYAHDLERSAKRRCRPGDTRVRSALDFAVLTAGDASRSDLTLRGEGDGRPIAFGAEFDRLKDEALKLARLPSSQLTLLRGAPAPPPVPKTGAAARPALDDANIEFAGTWRYQVARTKEWQAWYQETDRNWCDPHQVVAQRPRPVHLDFLHLLSRPST